MPSVAVEQVLICEVGNLVCAVPAEVTREVLSPSPTTRLPGAPPAVDGLVNVRGTLLTVVDAHRLLDMDPDPGHDGAVVVLEVFDRRCGLYVGRVDDLVAVPLAEVENREALPGVDPRIVRAIGRRGNTPFVILNLEELLRPIMGT
jgi:purine-binding chemotaxis protein CheW